MGVHGRVSHARCKMGRDGGWEIGDGMIGDG